jgi:hypothetical protein
MTMKLTAISQLPLSADHGWPEIARLQPGLLRLLVLSLLPLSLLPPAMLYYAGSHYPEVFLAQPAGKDWEAIAVAFFLLEMATLTGMGWLIRQVAATNGMRISQDQAYFLATIAPVPLWISSLGLLVPSLGFNVLLSLTALGLSCAIIYHGIQGLCHTREGVPAAATVQTVIGAGLIAWALLLLLVVVL